MVHTVKVKREDIPKELQMLLENGKDSNGEEVFSHMPEDLIYLAALVNMQSSMLHLLMLHGNPLPPEAWKFAASIPKMADATLEKWEEYAQPYM